MLDNALDAISKTLGAATPIATLPRPSTESKELVEKEAPEIENDYQEARSNLKELIGQAMEYIPEVMELTKQAQSDKMINAAATFIKAAADLNLSLSKLSKEIKTKKPEKSNGQGGGETPAPIQQITQNNNVFVGSTEDFLDMMEKRNRAANGENVLEAEYVEVKPT